MRTTPPPGAELPQREIWSFANCTFDELRYELCVCGKIVDLERKPLELLRYLLLKADQVVKKEELLEAVWPGVLVVDGSLATAVSKLRKVFGEQEIIQTVPRVGYRIAVPVRRIAVLEPSIGMPELDAAPDLSRAASEEQATQVGFRLSLRHRPLWAALGLVVVAVVSLGLVASRGYERATRTTPQSVSVAILPFQNESGGESLDYLRSALPDEIAHTLSGARSLTIRPLAASAQFAAPAVDFRKAGKDLEVNRLITGHFLIAGGRLRVTVEAVDATEDKVIWYETVDVAANNLLSMQEKVAAISRGELAGVLGVQGFIADLPPHPRDEEAYELYLKSIALAYEANQNRQGIDLLRRVVLLDPNYTPAWDQLAIRYYRDARFGGGGPEMMAFSEAAAQKELALNPDSLNALGEMTIHRAERGDLVKAHEIALELVRHKPDDPNLHHVLSYVLRYGGSLNEAGRECEIVVLLATKVVWGSCATTFMELGNYERARFFLRRDLSSEWSKAMTIEVLMRQGRVADAVRIPAPQIPHWGSYQMLLACARNEPAPVIQSLVSKVEIDDDPEINYLFAGHLAYCGQEDAAMRWLKTAIDHGYCSYPAMDSDPLFAALRTNGKFQKVRLAGMACLKDFVGNRDRNQISPAHNSTARSLGEPAIGEARREDN